MEITQNRGVGAVYDPIGYSTSRLSFESLSKFGIYVSYGQISGIAPVSFLYLVHVLYLPQEPQYIIISVTDSH